MKIWPRNKWRKRCSLKLYRSLNRILSIKILCWSSTQAISVETYKIRTSRSNFWPMLKYLYKVSFLTTLDIYKAYFKGRRACIEWSNAESAQVHYSLWRSYCIFMPRVLWPRNFLVFIVDELKNFAANNLFKLLELVTY